MRFYASSREHFFDRDRRAASPWGHRMLACGYGQLANFKSQLFTAYLRRNQHYIHTHRSKRDISKL